MNIERLHRILIDLGDDIKTENIATHLNSVQTNLQNQISQPNQPTYQKNLVTSLKTLRETLDNSSFNNYSPSWKETIYEIGGKELLGKELKLIIDNIFSANTITPANALEEIKVINVNFKKFSTSINTMLTGMKGLNIGSEELEPGECELGYTIPRLYVENELSSLKKEIAELNFILNSISEAVTGEQQEFKVKTISSSEFLIYLIIGLKVADVLSKATERILNHYKQILEIKILRNQLTESGVPASKTKSIETHANGIMKTEIKKIASEIMEEYYDGENGRKNELENSVIISLNKLANRIDNGFNIEIRVEPLPEKSDDDTENTEEEQAKTDLIHSIQESAKKIEYIEMSGQSILELPESIE